MVKKKSARKQKKSLLRSFNKRLMEKFSIQLKILLVHIKTVAYQCGEFFVANLFDNLNFFSEFRNEFFTEIYAQ